MENLLNEPAVAYNRHYTPEEYLNMEWENGVRYEYWEGELVEMSLTTQAHNDLVFNINKTFRSVIGKTGCKSFQESIKVRPNMQSKYFLPDVILTCHPDDINPQAYQVNNPSIIVEVLSDSTELYDRTRKWDEYRKIKSLRHYLLVSQHTYRVEMFSRTSEHGLFFQQIFEGLENIIPFRDMGFEVTLAEVYEGISFQEKEEEGGGESS